MILRKYMSLLGVGSASVDLILPKEEYRRGEHIYGHFFIRGGTVEQQIKRIECDLVMINKETGKEEVVDSTNILSTRQIDSEELNKIEFTFKLPEVIPVSSEEISYRFKTKLTFNEGIESRDQDFIRIV
ncbi:sporulation protein [Peribacillus acanthi]|uniref:sporulation protein n=1 Tax=Peribacillus acanthi TaxID=2171554 RepID=UPI000D3E2CFB|nr:sporulation protein [Peribacillus acanthi]